MRKPASRIHRGLTGARELIGTRYLADPTLRRQYADEIAPRTGAALAKILNEIYAPDDAGPKRVLDLGAGTGAVGAALRARFGDGLEVVAVDQVAAPGVVAVDLARALPPVEGRFELIVAAHLLGELFVDDEPAARIEARARRVLAWCRALLEEGGTMILVEPALRETSRALLGVRDRLVVSGLHVLAPCLWTGPCPALARERDWCHDVAKGLGGARVDFSYLVLSATPPTLVAPTLHRVVSDRLVEKGRLKIFGCGPAGRHAFVRLDRATTPANAALDDLARGDMATIAGTTFASDGLRISGETHVARAPSPVRRT